MRPVLHLHSCPVTSSPVRAFTTGLAVALTPMPSRVSLAHANSTRCCCRTDAIETTPRNANRGTYAANDVPPASHRSTMMSFRSRPYPPPIIRSRPIMCNRRRRARQQHKQGIGGAKNAAGDDEHWLTVGHASHAPCV